MTYVVIQTIQLLGRRVLIKISCLSGALMFSGLFQILPLMFILPMIRVIARPNKQGEGLPRRMKALLPEDLANTLDNLIATTETKILIISVVGLAVALFGIQALMTKYIKKYTTNFLNQQSNLLAHKLFNNYLEADVFSYANPMNKINSGCKALSNILNQTIMSFFNLSMFFLVAFILAFIYPLPGLVSILIIVTAISVLFFVIQPKMTLMIREAQRTAGKRKKLLSDSMNAIKEIKLMGRERFFFNSYISEQIEEQNYQELVEKLQAITLVVTMVMRYLGIVSGILLAIYTLPKEELAGFAMIFILLSSKVTMHAQQIVQQTTSIYQSLAVLQLHYKTLLKYSKASTNFDGDLIECKEGIEFKDLYFRHQNVEDEEEEDYENAALLQEEEKEEEEELPFVLENLSFKVKQGQFVGLVGRNGSGKSTILDLFSGLIIPTQGSILIDGKELGVSDRKNWRQRINYVIQKPHIISESILYNVTLGLSEEEVDQQLLEKALKLSMLDQVIEQLPKGLGTEVGGGGGTKISGGQAQRIVLARAIYQDRPVLLLDEATRAIDAATEAEIMEQIASMRGKKTLIIVTHRVQSLKQCDKIFVLEDKKIVAEGDYETLCETSELFRLFALGERKQTKGHQRKIPSVA